MLSMKFGEMGCFFKLLLFVTLQNARSVTAAPKIAIIGGGIGGASVSHYLSELFNGEATMDLFEAKRLGGRLATVKIAGNEYEAGGAIIHDKNILMRRFVKSLGMEERPFCGDQRTGIWNKEEFVFTESSYGAASLAKLIYRYGLEPFRLRRYVNSVLEDFGKIYRLQEEGAAFANVTGLLAAMNAEFPKMLKVSVRDRLDRLKYSSRLIDELVEATLVVNYGQDTNVHSFVGCVSIAGAGANLWAVKGGNKNVVEHLIYRNRKVQVVRSRVNKIVHLSGNGGSTYEVHYSNDGSSDGTKSLYDAVILAVPLTSDQETIEFTGFPDDVNLEFPGEYQTTIATFVHGDLNLKYFDLEDPLDAILSCNVNRTVISSVGNVATVDGKCSKVWKIFTREPLEQSSIEEMFTEIERVESIKWLAYPKYTNANPRMDFKLFDSLYHVNAIEWAASAMEMSAIAGRNVAILAHGEYAKRAPRRDVSDVRAESLKQPSMLRRNEF